jgi:hypothetical protein
MVQKKSDKTSGQKYLENVVVIVIKEENYNPGPSMPSDMV